MLFCLLFHFWGFDYSIFAHQEVVVQSPDKTISFHLFMNDGSSPSFQIKFQERTIIENGTLGLNTNLGVLHQNLKIGKVTTRHLSESYELIVGKAKTVVSECNEMLVSFKTRKALIPAFYLRIRAFNDGVAFRYEVPESSKAKAYEIIEENTSFEIAGNPLTHALILPNYTTSHEGLYTSASLDSLPENQLIDTPFLLEFANRFFMAITEAALVNYAGMYLVKTSANTLKLDFAPHPKNKAVKVISNLPHQTPWRVLMMGNSMKPLMESNILTHLNEPCSFSETSWIKPGKATWTWWNGDIIKNVDFEVGQNFESHQYNIDFCARNKIEYHSIIEHGNYAWYVGDGKGFDPPPPNADVTRAVSSLNMDSLAAYSKAKGVGLRVWVHWKPLSEKMETAFAQYEKWNIKGLMVDFMDRDDQEMVNWVEKVLQTAAKYHLHIQFHGAYKPTGLHRTYPNEFTKEGVLNLENLKWANECDPEHNMIIPFTRMLAGATDYHAGGFRSVTKTAFEPHFHEPDVLGTRGHHLALYVVFESYLHLVSDYPQAYENQLGFEFIREVPTTWDESRFLTGEIGNYIAIARRKGEDWYIGAMTDWTPRIIAVDLDFLDSGLYLAEIYRDAENAGQNPNALVLESRKVSSSDKLELKLSTGGGFAVKLSPVQQPNANVSSGK